MHIQLESPERNTIRSYTDTSITIGNTVYPHSVIISREILIADWPVRSIQALNETNLETLLALQPDLIIIGHQQPGIQIPLTIISYLSTRRVGIECMSIGAACRTFNLLLSEQRLVVAGIII